MIELTIADICTNGFGSSLSPEMRNRVLAFLESPSMDTWEEAYSIIIDARPGAGLGITLWQSWIAVDPNAPLMRSGDWPRIPDSSTLYLSILEARKAVEEGRWQVGLRPPGWLHRQVGTS